MNKYILQPSFRLFLVLLLFFAALPSNAQRNYEFESVPVPVSAGKGFVWELQEVLSDDFNYPDGRGKASPLFTSKWQDTYAPDSGFPGPGATFFNSANSAINNSTDRLEIRATPRNVDGNGNTTRVNCGVVSSKTKISYPIFMEANIKVANVENSSNFWLLDNRGFNEIDILEIYGGAAERFHSQQMSTNFHLFDRDGKPNGTIRADNTYQTYFQTNRNNPTYQTNNTGFWRTAFHRFGVYWKSPTEITFYIDGLPVVNGNHFVPGRLEQGLTGSYAEAILQSPDSSDGLPAIDKTLYNNQVIRDVFMILDIESHVGRPISPTADLNNPSKNLMQVEWVRSYKPVSDGSGSTNNRPRTITFDNRAVFIPTGETDPIVDYGDVLPLNITYATGIVNGDEEDLDYVAVQLVEWDESGTIIAKSAFENLVPIDSGNTGFGTYNYTIPRNFESGVRGNGPIPRTSDLDPGHSLGLSIFMAVDGVTAFKDANDVIIIDPNFNISNRSRLISFNNRDALTPAGQSSPVLDYNEVLPMQITYASAINNGSTEDVDYIAVQIRELDEFGNTVATSALDVVAQGDINNTGSVMHNYIIPTNFATGPDQVTPFNGPIPQTSELDTGHSLLLLVVMSLEGSSIFADDNNTIAIDSDFSIENRERFISFVNRDEITPEAPSPVVDYGDTISMNLSYATGITNEISESLDFVAVQIREIDELGNTIGTSAFSNIAPNINNSAPVNFTYDYTIPTNFATGPDGSTPFTEPIPKTSDLDPGHELLLVIFMSVNGNTGFSDDNTTIVIDPDFVLQDRERSISFANRNSYIYPGETHPVVDFGEVLTMDINYSTGISNEVVEQLSFIAVQIRELDESGEIVATSRFENIITPNAKNKDSFTFDYVIPTNYATGADGTTPFTEPIPRSSELDTGHDLLLLLYMSVEDATGFANDNDYIVIDPDFSLADRERSISFDNRDEFIPVWASDPVVDFGDVIAMDISYATDVKNEIVEDLDFVVVQIREIDESGNTVASSKLETVAPFDSRNADAVTYEYTIPTNYTTGVDDATPFTEPIPETVDLDPGHTLLLLLYMSVNEGSTFINANDTILIGSETLSNPDYDIINTNAPTIYPNPTEGVLNISDNFKGEWKIYNITGALLYEGNTQEVNVSELPSGLYYISMNENNTTLKFIKK